MIKLLLAPGHKARIAWMMLLIMAAQMVAPNLSMALSSGPVQPEIQAFEPVGTTDMVDLFTGDFVYNIPLMDVEGYPINISYHGGVTMEQEASWVGLGWNISPGAVNRAVRGLPDDFAGDMIEKDMNVKEEKTVKIGFVANMEMGGWGDPIPRPDANLGSYLTISNYRGVSLDFTASSGINTQFNMISAGMNVGVSVGSQAGASVDYGMNVGVGVSQAVSKDLNVGGGFNLNRSGVYSPRTGARLNVGWSANVSASTGSSNSLQGRGQFSTGTTVPIGLQNYTAAITNSSYMNSVSGQVRIGGEIFGGYIYARTTGSLTTTGYDQNGSRNGYGYFNLDKAGDEDLVDFSREKDGLFNTTLHLLPQSHLTYDIYSVTGQGTGGSFRPVRNDIGSIYDPFTQSHQETNSLSFEGGIGNEFEFGGEYINTKTDAQSGPWDTYQRPFTGKKRGYYEDVYFKEAGELTESNDAFVVANFPLIIPEMTPVLPLIKNDTNQRTIRANYIYTTSGADKDTLALLDSKQIISYDDTDGFKHYPTVATTKFNRVNAGTGLLKRKEQQVTEIVQVQKDGRRYVYGLPVLNNVQREATFAIDKSYAIDHANYLTEYRSQLDDTHDNGQGRDHFYSSTVTPTYVAAHLLTGVLSKDYIDVTGNGISDDDLGTYTRFNYTRKSRDYRWRSPLDHGKAQYMPGYVTDDQDDKASYLIGSREQWLLHSIETRNYVAEFYVSPRHDAKGVKDTILSPTGLIYQDSLYKAAGTTKENLSYKLDSIVLYNKHDRFINNASATPIKTVLFSYDYSLCKNIPNGVAGEGKLTLKKIQIKYGTSNLNLSAAYSFNYDNDHNYDYQGSSKDRWGYYKPNDTNFNNYEFPFTTQSSSTDGYSKAWSLSEINLPSGGVIKVDYESDDYAYVQDKTAMEMFKISGFGPNATYRAGNQLYFSTDEPDLYLYFERRIASENSKISFRDNYLKDTILYYNVPVEIADGKYEPIKGYAQVDSFGRCSDSVHGFIRLSARVLDGTSTSANPIVFNALNTGRYSLPQIVFYGADPNASDIQNIVLGMVGSLKELIKIHKNPLGTMIDDGRGQYTDLDKSFARLTSPGLKKKGGGQRVKSIKFYDNWNAMVGGSQATYGKTYDYTMDREDGKGVISSGVASWEPIIGGDELPQRLPVYYEVQEHTKIPPNDAIDLYQEWPIGESFYPAPVVGYSKVTVRSINIDAGRSSQAEDVSRFYTAKDFPIIALNSAINSPKLDKRFTITDMTYEQTSTQGFAITLNDMHGKPRTTEHWILKPAAGTNAKELVNSQQYIYHMQNGQLNNDVKTFQYNPGAGKLEVVTKRLGVESDVTLDARVRNEHSKMTEVSGNTNGFIILVYEVIVPCAYPFYFENNNNFRCATVTKVTQRYGILDKVVSNNQGAVTDVRNEVFDPQTGNALVTSVNNEFGDREYTVNYPAHWAYKELGPTYENQNVVDTFKNPIVIDSLGDYYASKLVNYNSAYNSHFNLPSNMPVGRIIIDEDMPKFKLGDELLVQGSGMPVPVKVWVMGYTSDIDHCYLVVATREPYKRDAYWDFTKWYPLVGYRVLHSGNKNRLGETIQSYTTDDKNNVFPFLKDTLRNLISLNASKYDNNLSQVYAANRHSDSLNPFITGKVGMYRPEMQIINLKSRGYNGSTTRNAGLFSSDAYWKTELDNYAGYCPDTVYIEGGSSRHDTVVYTPPYTPDITDDILTSMRFTYLGGDSIDIRYERSPTFYSSGQGFDFNGWFVTTAQCGTSTSMIYYPIPWLTYPGFNPYNATIIGPGHAVIHDFFLVNSAIFCPEKFIYRDGTHTANFSVTYNISTNKFTILRPDYALNGVAPATFTNTYVYDAAALLSTGVGSVAGHYDTFTCNVTYPLPYRIRRKILLDKVGHYPGTDNENWVKTQQVTKYNWFGEEIENYDQGLGYNSAIYGYNQQLPAAVVKNAKHGEVLFDGFEDYAMLQSVPDTNASYMPLYFSPFAPLLQAANTIGTLYKQATLASAGSTFTISKDDAHTGTYSLKTGGSDVIIPLNGLGTGMDSGYSFRMLPSRKYVVSVWLRPQSINNSYAVNGGYGNNIVSVSLDTTMSGTASPAQTYVSFTSKSNIIDGWQQYETTIDLANAIRHYKNFKLILAAGYYFDDIRIYPFESNSKGFVYHPVTRKLMATLDENNFATFFEYDAEGNLVRTKKETEKGILTVTESRSTHYKSN